MIRLVQVHRFWVYAMMTRAQECAIHWKEPDIYSALETFHEWYQKGIINPDAATLSEARVYNMWRVAQGWETAGITSWGPQMGKEVAVQKVGDTILSNETVRGSLNMVSINTNILKNAFNCWI